MKRLSLVMAIQVIAITAFGQSAADIPISMQPEGTVRAYFRSGMATSRGTAVPFEQNTHMAMMACFAPDGQTVYLQNVITNAFLDTWVRGQLSDDGQTLTVPLPQPLWWYDAFGYGLMLGMVNLDVTPTSYTSTYNPDITEVTFTIDGDEIRLNGTSSELAIGVVYTDDFGCVGMNDYETVFHYEGDEMVQVPAEATRYRYVAGGLNQDRTYEENINAEVATLGNDVWFRGYTSMLPTAWIHGTLEGDKVLLPKNQLVGTYGGYPLFYCSNNGNDIADGRWSYDAESRVYSAENFSFINSQKDDISHFGYFRTLEFKPAPEHDGPYQVSTDPIVSKQPVGELRTMMRSGFAYFYNEQGDYIAYTSQGGLPMHIVYADDRTVWMLNPVSYCAEDKWVKGTLSDDGSLITVPLGQQLYYDSYESWGYATALLRYDSQKRTYVIDENQTEVTFLVEGDCIKLQGCDEQTIYGVIYTDDYSWTGYGDYLSVYSPIPESPLHMPTDADAQLWTLSYTDFEGNFGGRMINAAIQGDHIYLSNLTDEDAEAAIVGTIVGDSVTFLSGQYLGDGKGYYCFFDAGIRIPVFQNGQWYYDFDYAPSITLAYNPQQQRLTANEGTCMLVDAGRGEYAVSYVVVMDQPVLSSYTEHPSVPEDPVILYYDDSYFTAEDGYTEMNIQIRPYDTEGDIIRLDRLYYRLFTRVGDEVEPYIFYEDEYINLSEDLVMLPYNFTDEYDFGRGGSYLYLYETGYDDLGVQVVNMSSGIENFSNIVWLYAGVQPGSSSQAIAPLHSDSQDLPCYNLHGLRIQSPRPGQLYLQQGHKRIMLPQ